MTGTNEEILCFRLESINTIKRYEVYQYLKYLNTIKFVLASGISTKSIQVTEILRIFKIPVHTWNVTVLSIEIKF